MSHNTDFHQFMLSTPAPGTPLYAEMLGQGRMVEGARGVTYEPKPILARRNRPAAARMSALDEMHQGTNISAPAGASR